MLYIYIIYLDLHLALFLFIAVFAWIYARSDILCSLELEKTHLFLDGRAFTLFSRIFKLISRKNTLIILASKCTKCKNARSGGISLMWRKTAQKAEISEMSISLCFFEDTGIFIYIYIFIYLYICVCVCQACERLNTNCAFVALSHVPSLAENSSRPFHKNAMSLVDIRRPLPSAGGARQRRPY